MSFNIYIITPDGNLRNDHLVSVFPNAHIISGFDGRNYNFESDPRINQLANQIVIGRSLSSTQAAAVLSHNKAQQIISSEWTCILEDDALILDSDSFDEISKEITSLTYFKPVIFLLYSGFGGTYSKFRAINSNFSIARTRSLPTGAVGYFLNKACQELISSQRSITGAPDWPTWAAKVKFFQIHPPVVFHTTKFDGIYKIKSEVNDSLMWPAYRKSIFGRFRAFWNSKITKCYGGRNEYLKTIILPAIYRKINQYRSPS
jgi:hypothetical protein